jgi:hypothetical protein
VILFINGTLFLLRTSTRAPRSLRIVVSYYIILLIRYVQVVIQPARVSLLLSFYPGYILFCFSGFMSLSIFMRDHLLFHFFRSCIPVANCMGGVPSWILFYIVCS